MLAAAAACTLSSAAAAAGAFAAHTLQMQMHTTGLIYHAMDYCLKVVDYADGIIASLASLSAIACTSHWLLSLLIDYGTSGTSSAN
jgi:hypothetical protein